MTKATNTYENNLFRVYFFPRKQALRGFFLGFIQILKNSSQGLERKHTLTLPINVAKTGLRFAQVMEKLKLSK